MGAIYGRKVMAGERTIDSVPKVWRKATEAWLDANGWAEGAE